MTIILTKINKLKAKILCNVMPKNNLTMYNRADLNIHKIYQHSLHQDKNQ
jgi:hypothetical protein